VISKPLGARDWHSRRVLAATSFGLVPGQSRVALGAEIALRRADSASFPFTWNLAYRNQPDACRGGSVHRCRNLVRDEVVEFTGWWAPVSARLWLPCSTDGYFSSKFDDKAGTNFRSTRSLCIHPGVQSSKEVDIRRAGARASFAGKCLWECLRFLLNFKKRLERKNFLQSIVKKGLPRLTPAFSRGYSQRVF